MTVMLSNGSSKIELDEESFIKEYNIDESWSYRQIKELVTECYLPYLTDSNEDSFIDMVKVISTNIFAEIHIC